MMSFDKWELALMQIFVANKPHCGLMIFWIPTTAYKEKDYQRMVTVASYKGNVCPNCISIFISISMSMCIFINEEMFFTLF